ncbi:chromosomal replication initiator protein DnaA [Dermabacteraceae bacterium P13136]
MWKTIPMPDESMQNNVIWSECLTLLRNDAEVSDRAMAFLTLSRLTGFFGDTALLAVPSNYAKDVVEQRFPDNVRHALSSVRGRATSFAVTIEENLFADDADEPLPPAPAAPVRPAFAQPENAVHNPVEEPGFTAENPPETPARPAVTQTTAPSVAQSAPPQEGGLGSVTRLNDKYTFERFVVGSSNRFAHAAAGAVAENPARAYNPLFIYGGSGLGKTHLLHAVGHYAIELNHKIQVRYVNSEEFTNDFINSVQSGQYGKTQEFHRRYRDIDILLIDDIQFLQRAPETMEAFFHTFNTLHNANKQIVITSDLPPKQLDGFEDRMRSRFEMGLMVDIQPPDLETRIAILRKMVETEQRSEVPPDVLQYIASRINTNIRELEGALTRVLALHSLSRQPLDVAMAETVLQDLLAADDSAAITVPSIMHQTALYFNVTVDDLCSKARTRHITTARQIAMYLCRELTDVPLTGIGQQFGDRDHTTVMHANKKIAALMGERQSLFNQVTELTARIKNATPPA